MYKSDFEQERINDRKLVSFNNKKVLCKKKTLVDYGLENPLLVELHDKRKKEFMIMGIVK